MLIFILQICLGLKIKLYLILEVGLPIEIDNDDTDIELAHFSTISSYIILEGVLDSKEISSYSINLVRLPYNVEKEIAKLEKSDIPDKKVLLKNLSNAMS